MAVVTVLVAMLVVPPTVAGVPPPAGRDRAAEPPAAPVARNSGPDAEGEIAAAERSLPPELRAGPAATAPECVGVHVSQYVEVNPVQRSLDLRCAYLGSRAAIDSEGWLPSTSQPPAFYLYDFVLGYDSTDGYVVLFGDPVLPSSSAPSQTWKYEEGNWTELSPIRSPTSCLSSAFADDPSDGYMVYFAGNQTANGSACPSAGQTWAFHGGQWTQLHPVHSPSTRFAASLSNDSADGYLVLFGGISSACPGSGNVCGDTWNFSGGNWTQLHPTVSPTNRSSAGMTYDAADGYVLLFGGEGADGSLYSMLTDTWSFRAGTWTRISTSRAPPEPYADGLAYDYADGYAVYTQVCGNLSNDFRSEVTWRYLAGNWSALNGSCEYDGDSGSPPPQRVGEGLTFDGAENAILFFGGGGIYGSSEFRDTWTYRAGVWTNRTGLVSVSFLPQDWSSAVYDASDSEVVVFGGANSSTFLNQTWVWKSGNWTLLHPARAPSPRWGAAMTYDASDGYVLLFGGYNLSDDELNDTWEFVGGNWTELTPGLSPPPGSDNGGGMVYDGADGYVVLFDAGTWTFHAGVWRNITATCGGPGPADTYLSNDLAYDATDGYVLLFGTELAKPAGGAYWTNQTWKFAGGKWTNLTASLSEAPPPTMYASIAGMGSIGGVVLYGGFNVSSEYNLVTESTTWVFVNGSWSEWAGPQDPGALWGADFVYDGAISEGILFGGEGGGAGATAQTDWWYWDTGPAPLPFIDAFRAAPGTLDVGSTTNLTTTVTGGTGPISFSYARLPAGCPSQNESVLTCTPANGSAGTYSILVTATDALGDSAFATTTLIVHARPTLFNFTADPGSITLGDRVLFQTTVKGGTAPYEYVYSGLPPGCASQTVPTLPCTPAADGTFTIAVSVTDALGEGAQATLPAFNVTPLESGGLALNAFVADPSQILEGNLSYLNVSANSTFGSLSYDYAQLPSGCATANSSSLLCVPSAIGAFSPTVTVTDAAGDSVSVSTPLTVYPTGAGGSLALSAFGASTPTFRLGGNTVLYIDVEGSAADVSYAYSGLPPGCTSRNQSVLPCTPTGAGQYLVGLFANASGGASATAHVALDVEPAVPPPPSPRIVSFAIDPEQAFVGVLVSAELVVADAPSDLSYSYTGLPAGCPSPSGPSWNCTVDEAGTYLIDALVTWPGSSAPLRASANLSVSESPITGPVRGTSTSPSDGTFGLPELAGVGALGSALAALATYALMRRRSRTGGVGPLGDPGRGRGGA